ncbi:hypothetical protein SAMD00019534_015480 [Acytostelium subglobosum LB1]|uniref:hypothetical protein n=1 Tax=Acytostelium subglobosum LB1 TaxID=1410327 RepID=UPI000644CFCE|nr:hypothetical protein SAMD00019534_015480 [Acytostelium subglobosum LB1]GAM18373.1 hypothetical protein SAMD00019534_015480 [Acytostelium subglobosum LB1]|eukprot:XP_012757593.1 hypothetical protein SAMD00019534_015480 [Acytostelium subglobosum LB1]
MPATYSTTRLNNLDCQMRHYAGAYNRDTIRMIAQRLSDDLYHDGSAARLEVAIEYANRQYRSGKFTKAGDAISLFNPDDKYNKACHSRYHRTGRAKWIAKSSNGPLRFADTYTGPLYKYDVSGMYAAIMRSSTFSVPIKKGEFHQLTDEELSAKSGFPFGIYRAIIKGEHRAFRPSEHNYYTHYDMVILI